MSAATKDFRNFQNIKLSEIDVKITGLSKDKVEFKVKPEKIHELTKLRSKMGDTRSISDNGSSKIVVCKFETHTLTSVDLGKIMYGFGFSFRNTKIEKFLLNFTDVKKYTCVTYYTVSFNNKSVNFKISDIKEIFDLILETDDIGGLEINGLEFKLEDDILVISDSSDKFIFDIKTRDYSCTTRCDLKVKHVIDI